jgi:hypothetical protein
LDALETHSVYSAFCALREISSAERPFGVEAAGNQGESLITTPHLKSGPARTERSMLSSALKTTSTAEARGKKGHSYRLLPTQFRRNGFCYEQIAREGDAAIYKQTWNGCRNPSVSYEVIGIRRREGFQIGARFVEPAEVYPNAEAWGVDGFTLTDKDAAFAKLREICR